MTVNNRTDRPEGRFSNIVWVTTALTVPMLALVGSPILWHMSGLDAPSFELISAPWFGLMGFNGLSLLTLPLIYLCGLALYVLRLRSLLIRVAAKDRALPVNAVWLVIAVPFNFVGSFFVITGVAASLASSDLDSSTIRRWRWLGITWCSFQVLAFLPNMTVSFTALLVSYICWAAHWVYSVQLDEQLGSPKEADDE